MGCLSVLKPYSGRPALLVEANPDRGNRLGCKTNSTVAEVVCEPSADIAPEVRCLEIGQETTEGRYTHLRGCIGITCYGFVINLLDLTLK